MSAMIDATFSEFPFVEELPKREKSKLARVWDSFQELSRISETEGMLIPVSFAAKVLGVSRQRVDELIASGRLSCHLVNDHRFVGENSVVDYMDSERKAGRPCKLVQDAEKDGAVKAAWRGSVEMYKAARPKRK